MSDETKHIPMTNEAENKEVREWIAHDGGSGFQAVGVIVKGPEFNGHIVLAEASALEKANARIKELRDKIEKDYVQIEYLVASEQQKRSLESKLSKAEALVELCERAFSRLNDDCLINWHLAGELLRAIKQWRKG